MRNTDMSKDVRAERYRLMRSIGIPVRIAMRYRDVSTRNYEGLIIEHVLRNYALGVNYGQIVSRLPG